MVARDSEPVIPGTGVRPPQPNRYGVPVALGRPKNGRQQQPRPSNEPGTNQPDSELDSYLAAISREESGPEITGPGQRLGAQVYQLRLPQLANERLKAIAERQGTSPAALATDWILQQLDQFDPSGTAQPAWPQAGRGAMPPGAGGGVPQRDVEITIPQERYR